MPKAVTVQASQRPDCLAVSVTEGLAPARERAVYCRPTAPLHTDLGAF